MRSNTEKFISPDAERDVLFVFGAGASVPDGVPLQKDILKLIFESSDENLSNSDASSEAKAFIQESFDISENRYPSLEAIFGYLDYFINKREGLGAKYTTVKVAEIREALIQLIHYVISKPNRTEKGTYRKFWEALSATNRNISVVTMNYDTLIDESFDFLYPDRAYIDYCIELMNYHHYDDISAFDWWVNPREPVPVWDGGDPKPIKLIKIHGALN